LNRDMWFIAASTISTLRNQSAFLDQQGSESRRAFDMMLSWTLWMNRNRPCACCLSSRPCRSKLESYTWTQMGHHLNGWSLRFTIWLIITLISFRLACSAWLASVGSPDSLNGRQMHSCRSCHRIKALKYVSHYWDSYLSWFDCCQGGWWLELRSRCGSWLPSGLSGTQTIRTYRVSTLLNGFIV
jgi:hypothetical protein